MICWSKVKRAILDRGATRAPGKFTRVSDEWKDYLVGVLRDRIDSGVHSHPSLGHTLYPPVRRHKEVEKEADHGS